MKETFKIALISILLLLISGSKADSAVLTSEHVAEKVKNDIIASLEQDQNGEKEVEVKIKAMPFTSLEIPDGEIEIKTRVSNLNSIVRVWVYVDKTRIKSFGVRVDVKLYEKVWVSQDWVKRGNALNGIVMEKKDISSIKGGLPRKNINPQNYRARRNIKPGKIIEINDIEEIPTIVKNSPVSVIFKTSSVSVTIPAVAMTSGKTGDFIKVKSKKYRQTYVGEIIGDNIVLVNI